MKDYTVWWRYKNSVTGWSYYSALSAKDARIQHKKLFPDDVVRKVTKGKAHITFT